jgi:anti-anti-sigma regulatory factor
MPTPCACRAFSEKEVWFRLPVTLSANSVDALFNEIRLRARCDSPARVVLDCSAISELPRSLLQELVALRSELRDEGYDLILTGCSDSFRRQLTGSEASEMISPKPHCHGLHAPQGPHAAFLRAFRARA